MDWHDIISDVDVYGLEKSIRRAKYPMATDISKLSTEVTNMTKNLASCKTGEGHDNFLKGIIVQFDLKLTVKCWTEAERYHFFDFISSQSTMHRITKFDLDKAYIKYVDKRMIEIMKEKVAEYNALVTDNKTEEAKEKYLEILYSNPNGFQLTAGMTTNYQQLKTIYFQRRTHRLPEWIAFCEWIEQLPRFTELVLGGN